MSFRKPFRADSFKLGPRYQRLQRHERRSSVLRFLGTGALAGAAIGLCSVGFTETGRASIVALTGTIAVKAGVARARSPQIGDDWQGCDDARAAGTAPIYRGEPGYRDSMDGDSDGIACEPYW